MLKWWKRKTVYCEDCKFCRMDSFGFKRLDNSGIKYAACLMNPYDEGCQYVSLKYPIENRYHYCTTIRREKTCKQFEPKEEL